MESDSFSGDFMVKLVGKSITRMISTEIVWRQCGE